jgi:hypothetical protein
MPPRKRPLWLLLLVLVLIGQVQAAALEASDSGRRAKPKHCRQVTAQEEEAVLQFLRRHHAELADLLEHLRSSGPSDYQKAVRDLGKARERLEQIQRRDRQRYELELENWVLQSKIQLLVARLAMNNEAALREQLRSLLGQRVEVRLRLLLRERERQLERLQKIDEQVDRYTDGRAEIIEKEFQFLTSSSKRLKQRRSGRGTKDSPGKASP